MPEKSQAFGQRAKQADERVGIRKDVDFDHTRSIATADWLRSCRSMAPTPVSSYSNKVFAGCTKNTSVKRQQKSRPVIAMRKMRHKLKGLVSGKILTRFRRGNGERPKRNAPRWCRTCFDEVPCLRCPEKSAVEAMDSLAPKIIPSGDCDRYLDLVLL